MHQSPAITLMHVTHNIAAQSRDAKLHQRTVMTKTCAQRTAVQMDNVSMHKSLVTTKMHVLMTAVMLQRDAYSHQNKLETQTCAQLEHVMQLKELLIQQETVMMETNALLTTVMLKRDANLFLNLSLKTVLQKPQDVKEMHCA